MTISSQSADVGLLRTPLNSLESRVYNHSAGIPVRTSEIQFSPGRCEEIYDGLVLIMQKPVQASIRLLFFVGLLLAVPLSLKAQAVRPVTPPPPITPDKSTQNPDDQGPTAFDEELRAKRAIKYAEKEHQENLTRARDASELGRELSASFKRRQSLNSDDLKKLEKLEKLTKKIRSEAGASDDEFVLEQKPKDLAEAVESVAKVSSSLSERVLKTPRQVVSAAIIEEANVLLELIRIVRNFAR